MKSVFLSTLIALFFLCSSASAEMSFLERELAVKRSTEAVIWSLPAVSVQSFAEGTIRDLGGKVGDVVSLSQPLTSQHGFLTANDVTPYSVASLTTADGPLVVEIPPASEKTSFFGSFVDIWFRPIDDVGPTGADQGKGAKYLFLPVGYEGDVPEQGYLVYRPESSMVSFGFRPVSHNGGTLEEAVAYTRTMKVYPLSQADNPSETKFLDPTGKEWDTLIPFNEFFFERLNTVIQNEPVRERDKSMLGLLAAINIEKGKDFAPSEEWVAIYREGAKQAFDILQERFVTPGGGLVPFYGEHSEWMAFHIPADQFKIGFPFEREPGGMPLIDVRAQLYFFITYIPKNLNPDSPSFYITALRDSDGNQLNGRDTYRLRVPADTPARDFWSVIAYSMKTKGFIRDAKRVGMANSPIFNPKVNEDGSTDVYFAPNAPKGWDNNWIPTGEDFFAMFRLYGPEPPAFDKSWVLPEIDKVTDSAVAITPKYSADVPESIMTPDIVETEVLGTLEFRDGAPSIATITKVYDNLDFSRGVQAFLKGIPATSIYAFLKGLEDVGLKRNGIAISERLLDARGLLLTGNSTVIYILSHLDLSNGPVVVEIGPGNLGLVDDAFFRYITDLGVMGQDRGKGGKYLFLPPGYAGDVPNGYFVYRVKTYHNWLASRAFVQDGDFDSTVATITDNMRIYHLTDADDPPEQQFLNISGLQWNTIHANDFTFYEELNEVIQREPADAFNPEIVGLFASIGIKKGQPFAPDERMIKILTEAATVGNATARALSFAPRDKGLYVYDDRQWHVPTALGRYDFTKSGAMFLDHRTYFHYMATGITPAMFAAPVGQGTDYAFAFKDSDGNWLDGSKTYKINLDSPVPVNNFWSFMVYSNQHRSMLETDQILAGLDNLVPTVEQNEDGSYTIWFGPEPIPGYEGNWIQTWPGKSWFTIFRLYGPEQPWFDKSWKLNDFELVE